MDVHIFQHVPFEGIGSIEQWLKAHNFGISATRFFEHCDLPDPKTTEFLIVMGGPMSVNDEEIYPWLAQEKRFIREVLAAGKPVLGICLGAQLMACALGARVYKNPEKEIGWFPVRAVPAPHGVSVFRFPDEFDAFHWHGETFDLPEGAVRLAQTAACSRQAFQIGTNALGLQFHLETTKESAGSLAAHCREDLRPSTYTHREEDILSAPASQYHGAHRLMDAVLDYLTGR